jgi:hypothetical protein
MRTSTTTTSKATPASLKLLMRATPAEMRRVRGALSLLRRREREKARYALRLSKRCAKLSKRCSMHAMTASHALSVVTRLIKNGKFTTTLLLLFCTASMLAAEPIERETAYVKHAFVADNTDDLAQWMRLFTRERSDEESAIMHSMLVEHRIQAVSRCVVTVLARDNGTAQIRVDDDAYDGGLTGWILTELLELPNDKWNSEGPNQ